ncbi:transposase [Candidatus Daviesbacteria bacterium]|nr:transposase [Candidatus Daviesbacteria bacterium]
MPYRIIPLATGQVYHVFNRGVAKMPVFDDRRDYNRFLETIYYYQFQGPKPQFSQLNRFKDFEYEKNKRIVEIICYCLMPNHYHFMLRQLEEKGISEFINKVSNSYTKYFNTRHERVGPLFQGQFKAVRVESDEQLIHLSRYIHLNPIASYLVKNLRDYPWSSYVSYLELQEDKICNKEVVISLFKNSKRYEQFVLDQVDYARKLELIKHKLLE